MACLLSWPPAEEAGVGRWRQLVVALLLTLLSTSCTYVGSATPAVQTPRASPSAAPSQGAGLGSIPSDCAPAGGLWPQHPAPWDVAFGASPVWIRNIGTAPGAGGAAIPFYPKSATTWGYAQKLLWIVEPGFTGAVTVTARNRSTGKHVYMRSGDTAPALALFLDPQHPGVPGSGDPNASNPQLRYAEFPTSIFIDAAGCIEFTAAWGTGHWSGTVAAGQAP
jgi:hypothetical protein